MKRVLAIIMVFVMISLSGCVIDLEDGLEIGIGDDRISIDVGDENFELGDLETYNQDFDIGNEESLDVDINVSAAKINIEKSEDKLFSGRVESNIVGFDPRMELVGNSLLIKDNFKYRSIRSFKNNWDLKFTDQLPLKFDITTNASKNDFDFTGLLISKFKLYANATDNYIRFDEKNKENMESFEIDVNAGNLEVYGLGDAGPEEIEIDVNAGKIALEFGENIDKDMEISIEGNASQTTLDLPDSVGVSIEKRSTLSSLDIDESEFIKGEDGYKSNNYESAKYKIDIEVRGTAFNLTVR
ncbi:toast rack family protein [Sporosalibacterium faouarense]|uniref:toast rack family protein n=1 Tax=Sporosalibacterium faouarense TaxID=516123 RepID=UPI00141C5109|nr:toast rack family protein [Sporosalibacterium faouarense]MTI46767.1 hypothetical protein [Bacillota bacterium]